jgi:hypothetical protein
MEGAWSRRSAKTMGVQNLCRTAYLATGVLAAVLAGCQGNLGSGTGLSIPQAPSYGQPGGPGGSAGSQSRQQVLEGADYMTSTTTELPLPQVGGFSVSVVLGTAPPSPVPGESSSPTAAHHHSLLARAAAAAAQTNGTPTGLPAPTASPAPAASVSPGAASSASPAPKSGGAKPSPSPSPLKIETKTIAYPDDAPAAPTPVPTGNVQTFVKRTAIVRGYVMPSEDITLYGLGAVRFTIPTTEQLPGRGFTVAVYQSGKHHKDKLLDSDTDAAVSNDTIASGHADTPLVLKKDTGYLLMLYGDEGPPTPAPVQAGYPTPGNNPFPMPSTYGAPQSGYPGQPVSPGGPTNPYATPTPFH